MIEIRHSGLNQYGADEVNKHIIKKYGIDKVNESYNGKLPYNVGDKFLYKLPTKKQYKNVKRFNKLGLENFVCTWEGMKIKLKHLSIEVYEVELKHSRVM
jgi:hypothetical protein